MRLHDVVGDAQAQSCSLSALLGSKKRLQDLVLDVVGDARTVVLDFDGDAVAFAACADLLGGAVPPPVTCGEGPDSVGMTAPSFKKLDASGVVPDN
jgi:hypothetical protein